MSQSENFWVGMKTKLVNGNGPIRKFSSGIQQKSWRCIQKKYHNHQLQQRYQTNTNNKQYSSKPYSNTTIHHFSYLKKIHFVWKRHIGVRGWEIQGPVSGFLLKNSTPPNQKNSPPCDPPPLEFLQPYPEIFTAHPWNFHKPTLKRAGSNPETSRVWWWKILKDMLKNSTPAWEKFYIGLRKILHRLEKNSTLVGEKFYYSIRKILLRHKKNSREIQEIF